MKTEILTGRYSWQEARRKASFGHKTWIMWVENDEPMAARMTAPIVKRAMLAHGTQGHFFMHDTCSWRVGWNMAITILRNLKRGYI